MAEVTPIADIAHKLAPVTATVEVEIPYTLVRAVVYELDESRVEGRKRQMEDWVEGLKYSARLRGWEVE